MKWRNSKERELLANGGSRDQTLPNKNNPNPDLSDAKTDRPQSLSPSSSPTLDTNNSTNLQNQSTTILQEQENGKKNYDQKFLQINKKFDLTLPPSSKSTGDFKFEKFDKIEKFEKFEKYSFYDNPINKANNQNQNQMFYDDYDEDSDDSDEEINVT